MSINKENRLSRLLLLYVLLLCMQNFGVYAEAGQITLSPTIESLRFSVQPVAGDLRVGVAVNATLSPAHIVVDGLVLIDTLGATLPDTLIVIAALVAVVLVTQPRSLVNTTVTSSKSAKVVLENVGKFEPTFAAPIFH